MKKTLLYILVLVSIPVASQESLNDLLNRFNSESIPYITVQELAMPKTNAIVLDAREQAEFNVSHLEEAIFVGYDDFKLELVTNEIHDKTQKIVVYCSVGIRSEDIAEKLKTAGYSNIYNLYGGIFEWKNNGFSVYDSKEVKTDSIHVYSKNWSKWLTNGVKVYE